MRNIGTLFGRPIGQYWEDLELWEIILNEFPHLKWIVELGTYEGGMSFYLHSQCQAREMHFATYDHNEPLKMVPHFRMKNVMSGLDFHTAEIMEREPGILFCDNGDKPKEVKIFHLDLHRESLIAVHDWGKEFFESDIPEQLRVHTQSEMTVFLARNDWLNELGIQAHTFN